MAQKLISLEEAAAQLGISKERLLELRTNGTIAGYRDGASWKFRSDAIERLAEEGIPQSDPGASDLGLELEDDLNLDMAIGETEEPAESAESPSTPAAAPSGLDLELADEEPASPPSDLSLDDVDEPTVAGLDDEVSDDELALDLEAGTGGISDSILLSEAELGDSSGRPPSTIIGKAELDLDADLDMSPNVKPSGPPSDVKLAVDDDDLGLDLPSPSADFSGLEELEVDLEAESSRILSPEDVAKVKGAMSSAKGAAMSDLELAPTDSDPGIGASDVNLGGSMAGGSLTGLSALELDDDDDVLGEGSDVTLSGESSGINIISPSDSGLALDQFNLSDASPLGSSLELGVGSGVDEGVALEPLVVGEGISESKIGEDFQLTPLGEEGSEEEERDSSQVIALEEISEESEAAPLGSAVVSEAGMMTEDFGMGLTPGTVPVSVTSTVDTPFSIWNVLSLAGCLLLLSLCGMMTFDLLRNMWSWDDVTDLNSSLLESVLNPFL